MKVVTLRLDDELHRRVQRYARRERLSMQKVIERLLDRATRPKRLTKKTEGGR